MDLRKIDEKTELKMSWGLILKIATIVAAAIRTLLALLNDDSEENGGEK